jgi:hypothetical protein
MFTVPMALITLAWGILGGIGGNIKQSSGFTEGLHV